MSRVTTSSAQVLLLKNSRYSLIQLISYSHPKISKPLLIPTVEPSMDEADKLYENTFPYARNTLKDPKLHHIANEKTIVNLYTKYATTNSVRNETCPSIFINWFQFRFIIIFLQ